MSDVDTKVAPVTFHPWRAIRELGSRVEVTWESREGILGSWCQRTRVMTLHPDQNQAERLCTAAHEGIHAERGDTLCDPSVHREAARRLISIEALADAALVHEGDMVALADELWVDEDTLQVRLAHLHPAERGYLRRRLEMKEHMA